MHQQTNNELAYALLCILMHIKETSMAKYHDKSVEVFVILPELSYEKKGCAILRKTSVSNSISKTAPTTPGSNLAS